MIALHLIKITRLKKAQSVEFDQRLRKCSKLNKRNKNLLKIRT